MRRIRVIPVLLISDGKMVKTEKFKAPKYVGDPINAIRIFNEKGVDELAVCDISKNRKTRGPDMKLMEKLASEAFMPMAYAGGISNRQQGMDLIKSGFEKLAISTGLMESPNLVTELSDHLGSQSVVAAVDYKQGIFGGARQYVNSGTTKVKGDLIELISKWVDQGAGEVWLNNIDREASYAGYDTKTIKRASEIIRVPIVSMGGAGSITHMKEAIDAGASAVAAGAMFIYQRPHNAVLVSYLKEPLTA